MLGSLLGNTLVTSQSGRLCSIKTDFRKIYSCLKLSSELQINLKKCQESRILLKSLWALCISRFLLTCGFKTSETSLKYLAEVFSLLSCTTKWEKMGFYEFNINLSFWECCMHCQHQISNCSTYHYAVERIISIWCLQRLAVTLPDQFD